MRGCGLHAFLLCTLLGLGGYMLIAAEAAKETTPATKELPVAESLDAVQKNIADKRAILVDVRSPKEWNAGHLDGAVHLPIVEWKQAAADPAKIKEYLEKNLPKDKIVYVHCLVGMRAKMACGFAEGQGYDLRPLLVNYADLVKAGFKEVK
jgi:rhodanese-related sulfurtransferase